MIDHHFLTPAEFEQVQQELFDGSGEVRIDPYLNRHLMYVNNTLIGEFPTYTDACTWITSVANQH